MNEIRRAYFDIVANVLQTLVDEPLTKTKVSGRANLDTRGTHRYIKLLVKSQLISMGENNNLKITSKGKEYLDQYRKLKLYFEQ